MQALVKAPNRCLMPPPHPGPATPHAGRRDTARGGCASVVPGTTVERATDAGPGTGTEEQDAWAAGPAAGEKSCPRPSHRWLYLDRSLQAYGLFSVLMCNLSFLFPSLQAYFTAPKGPCPRSAALSRSHTRARPREGTSRLKAFHVRGCQPLLRSGPGAPPPESPARTCVSLGPHTAGGESHPPHPFPKHTL